MTKGEASSYQGGHSKPDPSQAARLAKQHSGYSDDDDDESGVFSQIVHKAMNHEDNNKEVDEEEAKHAACTHDQIYNKNCGKPTREHTSRDLGSAAAMQAFKMFSGSGGSKNSGGSSQLIGLAMGEAQKLFKAQGGSNGGGNQAEMLQAAAGMAIKLLMTQQKGNTGNNTSGLDTVMTILGSLNGDQKKQSNSSGLSNILGKFL